MAEEKKQNLVIYASQIEKYEKQLSEFDEQGIMRNVVTNAIDMKNYKTIVLSISDDKNDNILFLTNDNSLDKPLEV